MKKNLIISILIGLIPFIILYLTASFVYDNFNINEWSQSTIIMTSCYGLLFGVILTFRTWINLDKNKVLNTSVKIN